MYRYSLEPYSGAKSRHRCPKCQHRFNTFKKYIDNETGQYLADHVGLCDRADQCGFHYTPREYFKANPGAYTPPIQPHYLLMSKPKPFGTIPAHFVADSCQAFAHNHFVCFLGRLFTPALAEQLALKYHIGTARHWPGATIFWQVDVNEKVRTGKIILYDPKTGRRVKEPFSRIHWVHHLWQKRAGVSEPFNLKQCLFGEHLLSADPFKKVAICESEKTAVIASVCEPGYIWLAAGSLDGLNADKCQVLKNRSVHLFPDVNGYAKWHAKARELNLRIPGASFTVNDELERTATGEERANGADMADRWIDAWRLENFCKP